jgi:nucleoside-diphosphate-sugar epimerase
MRIFVTGATGFIGTHLVGSLLRNGHDVAIIKRKDSGLKGLEPFHDKIHIFVSEIYDDIYFGIKEFIPDAVIHLAALYYNQHKPEHIVELINSNIVFGTYILEAMIANGVSKFLNVGTRWQHLKNKRYNPANLYSATKEAFKDILIYYGTKDIKHKTIELGDTYGSGDTRKKIMEMLVNACQKKEKLDLTPGEQILDLTAVDDISAFIVKNIGSPIFFDNTTVSISGAVIKLHDLGAMVEQEFKTEKIFNWGGKSYRKNEVMEPPFYYRKVHLNPNSLEEHIKNIVSDTI